MGVIAELLGSPCGAKTLPQSKTNGVSSWGTLLVKTLPYFLTSGLLGGTPWGDKTATGTNPYKECPNSGIVRKYDFTISRGVIAPDGFQKDVLLINNQFPGPLIEANWGDTIQVKVCNNITAPEEGTAIHWHGFLQSLTPWEDGVPSVSQCPIAPGKCFTYNVKATLYGSTWYHAHYSAQYSGGLFGPLVVYGPKHANYDVDVGPVMLHDWFHTEYYDIVEDIVKPFAGPPFSDNNLINGKGNFTCTGNETVPCSNNAGMAKFSLKPGKVHRLRLINTGAEAVQRFSLDGHKLTVIANDFTPVEPYTTDVVTLGVGQRTDVLVKADQKPGAYWMRSNITVCSFAKQPLALAAVYYEGTDTTVAPTSTPWDVPDPATCANDDLSITKPLYKMPVPEPSFTMTMEINFFVNASNVTLFTLDKKVFRGNYNDPILLHAFAGNTTFEDEWNVKDFTSNSSVRIILINNTPLPHPMHLHSMLMYMLHEGNTTTWDGTIVNAENPQRRDVQQIQAFGHLAFQFDADDNPGAWPFHCHIAWHASLGFFSTFVIQPEKIKEYKIPQEALQVCEDWDYWTKSHVPDQIDSGL